MVSWVNEHHQSEMYTELSSTAASSGYMMHVNTILVQTTPPNDSQDKAGDYLPPIPGFPCGAVFSSCFRCCYLRCGHDTAAF